MKKVAILVSVVLSVSFLWGSVIGCQTVTITTTPPILEFGELASDDEYAKWENEWGRWKPATAVIDGEEIALTSLHFEDLYVDQDTWEEVALVFEYNEEGNILIEQISERLIDHPLNFFWDNEVLRRDGGNGLPISPIIQAVIKDRGLILGLTLSEATEIYGQWAESSSIE